MREANAKSRLGLVFLFILVVNIGVNYVLQQPQQDVYTPTGFAVFIDQMRQPPRENPNFNKVSIYYGSIGINSKGERRLINNIKL